jgi:hypothetical protein
MGMNERIRELAEQQGLTGPNYLISSQELEKFAELLIQECLLTISKTPNLFTDEEVAVMVKCHNHVEEHFGVE